MRAAVQEPDPHPVQQPGNLLGNPVADPEIEVGIKGWDDLTGIGYDLALGHLLRHGPLGSIRLDGLDNLGVVNQPVNQHLSLGQLERAYFDVQAGTDFIEYPVDPSPQEPAGAGDQNPIQNRHGGNDHQQQKNPYGNSDLTVHVGVPQSISCQKYGRWFKIQSSLCELTSSLKATLHKTPDRRTLFEMGSNSVYRQYPAAQNSGL